MAAGSLIVDIRPGGQRESDGEIPGFVIVERNHLGWRLHPASGAGLPQARDGQEWIVVCTEGYPVETVVGATATRDERGS